MKFKDDKGKYLLEQIRDTAGQVNILCKVCENPAVEYEKHFLVECQGYNTLRNELFTNLNIHHLMNDEKFKHCLKEADSKTVSSFLINAYEERNV